jgi:CMP-N,N'-diacetyllegionaminic acid synthase
MTASDFDIIAIIPARGGSKGVPGKNLRSVAGKPLIAWTIEQARASSSLARVVVSTDNEEIAEAALRSGAEVPFVRPAELATDTAATEPALIHALDWLEKNEGYRPTLVMLLQPTCPVRKAGSINRAVKHFSDENANSLLSVREIHPFLWRNQTRPNALYDFSQRPRRQDVPEAERLFEETGSIYIMEAQRLRDTCNRLGGQIALFPMEAEESWDVDTEADLSVVEALLGRQAGHDY